MLEWNDVAESTNPESPAYYLVFWSDKKETLEKLSKHVLDSNTRCESCGGEVAPSQDEYLCLSGCGHVKGVLA